jgi:hypothetical protein
MAKSKQGLGARLSHATGRRRKKPANRVERAFDGVKQLVSATANRLFSRAGQRKATTKQVSAKKVGATRIRGGRQRQAAAKKAARRRGAKTS